MEAPELGDTETVVPPESAAVGLEVVETVTVAVVGATAVPESVIVFVLFVLASRNESVPVRVPAIVGLKVIETVQLWPSASTDEHVLVCAKSPVIKILWMVEDTTGTTVVVTVAPTATVTLFVAEPVVPVHVIEYVVVTVGETLLVPDVPVGVKFVPVQEVALVEE